jgi:hypothetical protein
MSELRYSVTVWHGESKSIFYVVDKLLAEWCISYDTKSDAENCAYCLNENEKAARRGQFTF